MGGYSHLTNIGQPRYVGGIDKAIALECYTQSGQTKGTQYQVDYPFKRGFRYTFTVKASNVAGANSVPGYLRLQLNNIGSGNNTSCNGSQLIDAPMINNTSKSLIVGSDFWSDYVFDLPEQDNSFPYFQVAAIPTPNSGYQTILVRSITITEVAVNPDLVLSPTSVTTICGASSTHTFTLSNPYNVTGITSYQWNLGSASNGWLYNGAPAPQLISTTTNSITLTADGCRTATLSDVEVRPMKGSTPYPRPFKATATTKQPTNLSIAGPDNICLGSGSYYIANLPCNAVVTWSIPYGSPATLGCTSCPQTTLQSLTYGTFTLQASVQLPCNPTPIILQPKTVVSGLPTPFENIEYNPNDGVWTEPFMQLLGSSLRIKLPKLGDFSSYSWVIRGNSDPSFSFDDESGYFFRATFNSPQTTNPTGTVLFTTTHPVCGTYTLKLTFYKTPGASKMLQVEASPVPAANTLSVSLIEQQPAQAITLRKNTTTNMSRIQVLDKMGNLKIDRQLPTQTGNASLDVSGLSNDIYILKVFDGKKWWSRHISVQR
ncbi:hypothetical protein DF182_16475 [Chitinophaga flava]|uniref:Secretion system C-terminal sorting domain-containing protein n=1 Tax=Chitinophaga flava TaxID=2259036 RepID=A0A365XPC7_9BACT|nr:hypothetical protein DF182_16475 [Chitinophaga flava]